MRSRAVREGSVGLLILVGLGLVAGVTLWLRELEFGRTSYNVIVEFANANGLAVGTPVRYRGVNVGKITSLDPGSNGVEVTLEVSPTDLIIPKDAIVKANQSGLLNQTSIDITPRRPLSESALAQRPLSNECQDNLIVCDNDRLRGEAGATLDDLLTSTVRLSEVYASPDFAKNLNKLLKTVEVTAADVSKLSTELNILSRSLRGQVPALSQEASKTANALNTTAFSLSRSANRIAGTVDATAGSLDTLSGNLNRLIQTNEANLGNTLASLTQTSNSVRSLLVSLKPAVSGLNTALNPREVEQLVQNLDTLITNAAAASNNIDALVANTTAASENLRDLSASFNDPNLILSLQQTLNSARETFDNARKITAEIDELTGDPAFRNNLRNLVNGLGDLLSSTEQLEEQVQVAQALEESHENVRELEYQIQVARQWQQLQKGKEKKQVNPEAPQPKEHLPTPTAAKEPTLLPIQSGSDRSQSE